LVFACLAYDEAGAGSYHAVTREPEELIAAGY
jgi:hypothetical protein